MATVEKDQKQRRREQTARDFERWLAKNPDASLKRRAEAFNAIADANYKRSRKNRPRKSEKRQCK